MRCASRVRRASSVATVLVVALLAACSGSSLPAAPLPTVTVPSSVAPTPTSSVPPAAPSGTPAALASFYDQTLRWTACGAYQCATLRVPRSYEKPDPDQVVTLPLLRNRADGKRIGSLVVNPGGPGGSGVGYARRSDSVLPSAVRNRYDVVGFDPRGVQGSSPRIDCISDAQLDRYISSETTEANAAGQLADAKAFANGCAKRSPALYKAVGTRDAAKDLDVLRAALGEKKLNYLGKSYGTLLGTTYAETFPDRVGRMVLDGVLDPSLDAEGILRGQVKGFETAYRAFLKDCVRSSSCPLGSSVDAAYARTQSWLDELEATPLRKPGSRALTRSLAELALLGSLYEDRVQWASLRQAFASAFRGSPYAMLALADSAVDRQPGGRFPNNANEAQYAITCIDRPYTATVEQTAERATRFAQFAPLFGEYIAWGDLPCTVWRTAPTRTPHRITADVPPILLVNGTRDPATPLAWARSLHGQLPGSRLITWKGDGHTAYFRGSGCVDSIVDEYLVDGSLPAKDPTCSGR